jgi:4-aminobutyrate aminotransferase-like enzyme
MHDKQVKVGLRWSRLTVAPPLTISESEIDEGLAAIDYALYAADELTTG